MSQRHPFRLAPTVFLAASAVCAAWASGCGAPNTFVTDTGSDGGADGTMSCMRAADCDDMIPCTVDQCLVGNICDHRADNTLCPMGQTCTPGRGCGTGTTTCTSAADCDDRTPCTRDSCLVGGMCRNQGDNTMCPMGQTCETVRGCVTGSSTCRTAADCNDTYDCTDDQCDVMMRCVHVPQNARCPVGRRCFEGMGCVAERACSSDADCDDRVYCNGMERCTELACLPGTSVNCADTDMCTDDSCVEATRMCAHVMNPTCMGSMARSGWYSVAPVPVYMCAGGEVNLNIMRLNFAITGTMLTVNGAPAPMTGTYDPMARTFTAMGVITGLCNETYSVAGNFTDANRWTGRFTAAFAGVFCVDCVTRNFMVTGTYMP